MEVDSETTVGELMQKYPNGFAVGPGTKENPGTLSRIIAASSHFSFIAMRFSQLEGNQWYMVVDMDEVED